MKIFKLNLLLIFSFVFTFAINAQDFDWKPYQSPEQVNDLIDIGDQLLMATDAGLVVLDKTTLETQYFTSANSNLPTDHIQAITISPSGGFWIGTYDVILARFDGNGFTDITVPEDIEYNTSETVKLYDLEFAPNGDLWVGTSAGALQRQGSEWMLYNSSVVPGAFADVWDIEISPDNDVYLASFFVYHFKDGIFSNMTDTTQLFAYDGAELFLSDQGDLLFTGHDFQIGHYDGTGWRTYSYATPGDFSIEMAGARMLNITQDPDGNFYFSSDEKGFFKLVDDTWTQQQNIQTANFQNKSSYLHIDEHDQYWLNNNIYLSTIDNGTLRNTKITEHTIESNSIQKIRKDQQGTLYFFNPFNSVATLDVDGQWSFLELPTTFITWEKVKDVMAFASDDLWLLTNLGLYHFDGLDWTLVQAIESGSPDMIADSQHNLYIGTTYGFYVIEDGASTHYTDLNSPMIHSNIFGMGIDQNDDLWISTVGYDVYRFSDGNWTAYSAQDNPALEGVYGEIKFDENGNVWIPTWGNGAAKFDGTDWYSYHPGNTPMTSHHVYAIESDLNGKVYFSYGEGILTLEDDVWTNTPTAELPMYDLYLAVMKLADDGTLWWGSFNSGVYAHTPESPNNILAPAASEMAMKIFPNPTSNHTTLNFETKTTADVQALIFNSMGQQVSAIDFGTLTPQQHQKSMDLSSFPKGIYMVQLNVGEYHRIGKIIID